MQRYGILSLMLVAGACGFGPDIPPKKAQYNTATHQLELAPCPDWRSPSDSNYNNNNHSNYGCATVNNTALQVENPQDLARGHGSNGPDTETTIRTVSDYREGKIPVQLQPQQTGASGQ